MRTEKDMLGTYAIEEDALYGIHAARARDNFPDTERFQEPWFRALGAVKLACYRTIQDFQQALAQQKMPAALPLLQIEDHLLEAMIASAQGIMEGQWFEHFIVPACSGGAGTSINMNINEIIANASLTRLGKQPGEYATIDPIEHANRYQSTNDIIPTSLKVASIGLLRELEVELRTLRTEMEKLEHSHQSSLRIAYTQMQAALPSSYGKLFSTYSDALSRDWWRVSKCAERLKNVNLGGGAIGTGLAIPRYFIFEVISHLKEITGLPIARSENLPDATANLDPFVEVHAILKAHAVNLEKIASDLRLLASDICGQRELALPARQVGSSIMPSKVNPVIPEFIISACHRVAANDLLISSLAAQGCLDLNAYLPALGHALLESLKLLAACDRTLVQNLLSDLSLQSEGSWDRVFRHPTITTALEPLIGYQGAEKLAALMRDADLDVFEANAHLGLLDDAQLRNLLTPEALLRLGYSITELIDHEA